MPFTDADDRCEIGQAAFVALRIEDFVGLFLIAAYDDLGLRVAQDVLQFRPRIGRVNAETGAADHLRGEVGVEPLRRVVACDRKPVAGAEAERIQPNCETPGLHEILAPARTPPHAEFLLAQCKALRLRLGAMFQRLRHGHERKALELLVHAAARLAPR
jgi:hypothetical protein